MAAARRKPSHLALLSFPHRLRTQASAHGMMGREQIDTLRLFPNLGRTPSGYCMQQKVMRRRSASPCAERLPRAIHRLTARQDLP